MERFCETTSEFFSSPACSFVCVCVCVWQWSIEPVPPEGRFSEEIEQRKVKEELYKEVSV